MSAAHTPVLYYIEVEGRGCGLTTETNDKVARRLGYENVRCYREATQKDVDWVQAMGGQVPHGRVAKAVQS